MDRVALPLDEVHVWWAPIEPMREDFASALRAMLSEDERQRQETMVLARRRDEYLVSRALVRSVLSHYRALAPTAWRFVANAHGRPRVAAAADAGELDFNLSHTRGMVVCAVAHGRRVGVDVEWRDETVEVMDIGARHFAPSEYADLCATPADARCLRFFTYWTLKESYIKARGQGLSIALDSFAFALHAQLPPQLHLADGDPTAMAPSPQWQSAVVPLTQHHLAALTFSRRPSAEIVKPVWRPACDLPHAPWYRSRVVPAS